MEVVTTAVNHPGVCNLALSALPEPKYVKSELEFLENMFIIRYQSEVITGADETGNPSTRSNEILWRYYPVKVSTERKGNFYKLTVSPPFISEGFVYLDNKLIHVTVGDLIRGQINVTRVVETRNINPTRRDQPEATARRVKEDPNKLGSGQLFESEISQAADMAFQNQIETLLYLEDSEED